MLVQATISMAKSYLFFCNNTCNIYLCHGSMAQHTCKMQLTFRFPACTCASQPL